MEKLNYLFSPGYNAASALNASSALPAWWTTMADRKVDEHGNEPLASLA